MGKQPCYVPSTHDLPMSKTFFRIMADWARDSPTRDPDVRTCYGAPSLELLDCTRALRRIPRRPHWTVFELKPCRDLGFRERNRGNRTKASDKPQKGEGERKGSDWKSRDSKSGEGAKEDVGRAHVEGVAGYEEARGDG